MAKVILERMPYKANRDYEHKSWGSAQRQAYALQDLHGECPITIEEHVQIIHVHASNWYKPKEA